MNTRALVPPTSFHTARLELRAAKKGDARDLYETYTSDALTAMYLQRRPHSSVAETEGLIAGWGLGKWGSDQKFAWSIRRRNREDVIGAFFLVLLEQSAEIHYGLAHRWWGHGLATEAGRAVMEWLISRSSVDEVTTICPCSHEASLNVLEKIGLKRGELVRDQLFLPALSAYCDGWRYAWRRTIPHLKEMPESSEV